MKIKSRKKSVYEQYIKRPQDLCLSFSAILILWPLLLIIAVLVRIKLGSPVIFKQKRPGMNGKIFTLYKFRTMTDTKDKNGKLLPDELRLTHFGKKLRDYSLDELPELFNIIAGNMSIIGPRPQLVKDMVFMTPEQKKRYIVRAGLSGLAQVNGRNGITWDKKLNYDLLYIKKITFCNDWFIVFQTIINVISKKGINTDGMSTSEDYGDYLLRIGRVKQKTYDRLQKEAFRILKLAGNIK